MNHSASTSTSINWLHWLQHGNRPVIVVILLAIGAVSATMLISRIPDRQMCPLFEDGDVSKSERNRILMALGTAGLTDFTIENGRIQVPVESQAAYLSAIADHQALPRDWSIEQEFQPNPFVPRSQQDIIARDRKKKQVRDMIQRLPYVAEAWLELDWAASTKMFEADRQSAVVMVRPAGRALDRQQVDSIQSIVSFAIAGMERSNVAVIDSSVGITWLDNHDAEQHQLIDLVHWTANRQEYYRQQLARLLDDYPGIEFDVEVQRKSDDENWAPPNKIADEKPDQLAARMTTTNSLQTMSMEKVAMPEQQVGLNSAATVVDRDSMPQPDRATSSEVVQVHYEEPSQQLPAMLPKINPRPNQIARANVESDEAVRITVRVPHVLLASIPLPSDDGQAGRATSSDAEKFEFVKTGIDSRIRQLIPESSLATVRPITVLLVGTPATPDGNPLESLAAAMQLYWPIGAVLLLSILFAAWSRTQPATPIALAASAPAASTDSMEKHLQQQLTKLIDSDPATAAKVIKSWIRQTE